MPGFLRSAPSPSGQQKSQCFNEPKSRNKTLRVDPPRSSAPDHRCRCLVLRCIPSARRLATERKSLAGSPPQGSVPGFNGWGQNLAGSAGRIFCPSFGLSRTLDDADLASFKLRSLRSDKNLSTILRPEVSSPALSPGHVRRSYGPTSRRASSTGHPQPGDPMGTIIIEKWKPVIWWS